MPQCKHEPKFWIGQAVLQCKRRTFPSYAKAGGEYPIVIPGSELHFEAMQRSLIHQQFPSTQLGETPDFNVVIAYEDFESGKQAKATYDFLVENLAADCRFSNQMWKFDVLGIPKLREMAAKDAATADIVILACKGSNQLPDEVKAWIELWLAEKSNAIALVALFDSPDIDTDQVEATREYLSSVAKRGGMEFFIQPYNEPLFKPKAEPRTSLRQTSPLDEEALSTLAGITQHDLSFPRWGINE
jgi:hypothetical protein